MGFDGEIVYYNTGYRGQICQLGPLKVRKGAFPHSPSTSELIQPNNVCKLKIQVPKIDLVLLPHPLPCSPFPENTTQNNGKKQNKGRDQIQLNRSVYTASA